MRFYFDVQEGGRFIKDDDGVEFPDLGAANAEAQRALAEMVRDALPGAADRCKFAVEVRDGSGPEPLFKAELTFAVQRFR